MTDTSAPTLLALELDAGTQQALQGLGWVVQAQADLKPHVAEDAVLVQAGSAAALQALVRRPGTTGTTGTTALRQALPGQHHHAHDHRRLGCCGFASHACCAGSDDTRPGHTDRQGPGPGQARGLIAADAVKAALTAPG